MKVFDVNYDALEADLSFRLRRQNLISSNIANHNTPDFQARDIDFDEALKKVYEGDVIKRDSLDMFLTDEVHMEDKSAILSLDPENEKYVVQAPGIDENGVDIDREMARMAENSMMYSASSVAIKKKLGILKYVTQNATR